MDVPYLSTKEIETDAALLLAEFNIGRGRSLAAPVPIEEIVENASEARLWISMICTRMLGIPMVGGEPEIFGALWVNSREVL